MSHSSERPRPMRYNMVQGIPASSVDSYYKQPCGYLLLMPLSPLKAFRSPFQDLPFDVLPPVLAQLSDSRDWHACALVNKSFCRVATPLLYRTLDSRIISKACPHPSSCPLINTPSRLSCIIPRRLFFNGLNSPSMFGMLQKQACAILLRPKPYLTN